jgi:hypothetical protein
MSKLLWKPWISYRIEEPLEHCMSIQAKKHFVKKVDFQRTFLQSGLVVLDFIYLFEYKSWLKKLRSCFNLLDLR